MTQYYAVWIGRKPGIYETWDDCKSQVDKFPGAKFRKLKNTDYSMAVDEFNNEKGLNLPKLNPIIKNPELSEALVPKDNRPELIKKVEETIERVQSENSEINDNKPIENVLTVDGASNGYNCEFQAVWYPSGEQVYKSKVYDGGTNNIAEFLGLVYAIKYLMNKNLPLNVYSDSATAMAWYRNKKVNTTANNTGKLTPEIEKLITDAEIFLKRNAKALNKANVMKWHTRKWGEIPADFGRKGNSKKPKF